MSRSLNKVMLIGNVGADPEMRSTPGGMRMARVSLATSREFTDRSGQKQEKTEWHRLTFWDKLADVVEKYVKKGDRLYVEGRIEYSTTGEGDAMKYWTDVNVREMVMLGGSDGARPKADAVPGGRVSGDWGSKQSKSPFESDESDLPFSSGGAR